VSALHFCRRREERNKPQGSRVRSLRVSVDRAAGVPKESGRLRGPTVGSRSSEIEGNGPQPLPKIASVVAPALLVGGFLALLGTAVVD